MITARLLGVPFFRFYYPAPFHSGGPKIYAKTIFLPIHQPVSATSPLLILYWFVDWIVDFEFPSDCPYVISTILGKLLPEENCRKETKFFGTILSWFDNNDNRSHYDNWTVSYQVPQHAPSRFKRRKRNAL